MKAIFGFLVLVVVLAAVGSIAKKQMQAAGLGTATRSAQAASVARAAAADPGSRDAATFGIPGGVPGATAADPNAMTVPQISRSMQEQARDRTSEALAQGMKRNDGAER